MTQLERAGQGEITDEIKGVALEEGFVPDIIRRRVASGKIVIPSNTNRRKKITGIGKGLRTKVNASIGSRQTLLILQWKLKGRSPSSMVQTPLWT
jgi:phosphomethylpyrimidine synthase